MNFFAPALCLIATLAIPSAALVCQDPGGGPAAASKQDKTKPEPFLVIQVDEDFRVVRKSEVAPLKKQMADQYKAAVEAYNLARKAAAKNKEKFEGNKPKKTLLKAHGEFKRAEDAQKKVEALKEKADKKRQAELDKAEKKRQAELDKAKGKAKTPPKKRTGS